MNSAEMKIYVLTEIAKLNQTFTGNMKFSFSGIRKSHDGSYWSTSYITELLTNCQIGRIKYRGFDHIKEVFSWKTYDVDFMRWDAQWVDKPYILLDYYFRQHIKMEDKLFETILMQAKERQAADYQLKTQHRAELPKRKRKGLKKKNLMSLMLSIIQEGK